MDKSLIIFASPDIGEFIKTYFEKFFHKVYLNPSYSEIAYLTSVTTILDLINYDTNDDFLLLNHNTNGLKQVIDSAKITSAKYFFCHHTNGNVGIPKKVVEDYCSSQNVNFSFVEIPDTYGTSINTCTLLNRSILAAINQKPIKLDTNNNLSVVYEEDVLDGLLNFIIHKNDHIHQRLFEIIPKLEFNEAYLLEKLINAAEVNANIVLENDLHPRTKENIKKEGYISWVSNYNLDEGLKVLLLALDIPIIISDSYKKLNDLIPKVVSQPKVDTKPMIPVQTETIDIYKKYAKPKPTKSGVKPKTKKKVLIKTLIIIALFITATSLTTILYGLNLFFASRLLATSIQKSNNNDFKSAYDLAEKAFTLFSKSKETYLTNILFSFIANDQTHDVSDYKSIFELNSELVKNMAVVRLNIESRIANNTQGNHVLGLSSEENIKASLDRSFEITYLIEQRTKDLPKDNIIYNLVEDVKAYVLSERSYITNIKNFVPYFIETLGFNTPQKYLLLIQDTNIAKASSGQIKYYGIIKADHGEIKLTNLKEANQIETKLSKENDEIVPPLPIRNAKNVTHLPFSESNWDIDFKDAAEDILSLYHKVENEEVHGIIAVNDLVYKKYSGNPGLQLNSIDEVKNLTSLIIEKITKEGKHSDINELVSQINMQNIILYSKNPEIQSSFIKNYWASTISDTKEEFVKVVDTNLTDNEVSKYITRDTYMNYSLDENKLKRELIVKYNYTPSENILDNYLNHVRIVLPLNVIIQDVLLEQDGVKNSIKRSIEIYPYQNKTIIALDLLIKPSQKANIHVWYHSNTNSTPSNLTEARRPEYSGLKLYVYKQSLANVEHVNIGKERYKLEKTTSFDIRLGP